MDTQNFINQVATGDAAGAKETLYVRCQKN
jgi:hypothetical protein